MTCTQSWCLSALLLCIVAIGGAFVMYTFARYCALMAKHEGRQSEWADFHADDGGLNDYKKEQWHKLPGRPYLQYADTELHAKGEKLTVYMPVVVATALIVIVAAVVLNTSFCR